jgi:hypothetical protein
MAWRRLRIVVVVVSLLGLAGCGGGNGSGTPTTPSATSGPFAISNLRVTQLLPHGLAFTVDFRNAPAAVPGGTCNAATNLGVLNITILGLLRGASATNPSGSLQCQVHYNPVSAGASVSGAFGLTDSGGNVSNVLSFGAVVP